MSKGKIANLKEFFDSIRQSNAEYKEKIKALNEMVGAKTAFPAGHEVIAGPAAKAEEKKDDAGHGDKKADASHHSPKH